jgi:hypothetical protein
VTPRIEQVFTFGSPSAEAILRAFSTESVTGPHGRVKVRVSGKADRAEGLPRLRDTDTSLITFREKQLSPAQTSLLPTKSPDTRNKRKRDAALQRSEGVFSGLSGRRRHTLQDSLILQAACNRARWTRFSDSQHASMEAQAHASRNRRAKCCMQATAPPLAPPPRLFGCGTNTATRGGPAHDPAAPAWRDGQYGRKWADSNDGGRRAGAAVTSSARLPSRPRAAREPPLTA